MKKLFTFCLAMVVCVLFAGKASAQTFTINYEQEGEGAIYLQALIGGFNPTDFDLVEGEPLVVENVHWSNKKLPDGSYVLAYELNFYLKSGQVEKVAVDGVESQEYTDALKSGLLRLQFTEQGN